LGFVKLRFGGRLLLVVTHLDGRARFFGFLLDRYLFRLAPRIRLLACRLGSCFGLGLGVRGRLSEEVFVASAGGGPLDQVA